MAGRTRRRASAYCDPVSGLLTALLGALVGLAAVALGAWLQARRERSGWLREQKLRAATDFTSAVRHLLNQYRKTGPDGMDQDDRREWRYRMQAGRATLYLLCADRTVRLADQLASALHATLPTQTAEQTAATEDLFRQVAKALRSEIGGG